MKHILLHNKYLLPAARDLRKSSTPSEQLLWKNIRRKQILGVQFYRQRTIGKYIVDFYAKKPELIIEVDGGYHTLKHAMENDANRDFYFQQLGIPTLRFTNEQILHSILDVISKIESFISLSPWGKG